jgi:hypothetical protein
MLGLTIAGWPGFARVTVDQCAGITGSRHCVPVEHDSEWLVATAGKTWRGKFRIRGQHDAGTWPLPCSPHPLGHKGGQRAIGLTAKHGFF